MKNCVIVKVFALPVIILPVTTAFPEIVVVPANILSPTTVWVVFKSIVFPNPTDGAVQIQFQIKQDADVDVAISDEVGRRIQTILKEKMPAGKYKYSANLDRLSDGVYVLTVVTEHEVLHSKIVVNK